MFYRIEVGIRDYWNHPQVYFANQTINGNLEQGVWVNDLSIIKLDRMVPAEEFIPICLPDENTNYDEGTQLSVYGTVQIKLLHIVFMLVVEVTNMFCTTVYSALSGNI